MRGDVLDQPLRALDVEDDLGARHARQHVAGQQREQLVAVDDAPVAVHRADAIGVAVEADAEVGLLALHRRLQVHQQRGHGGIRQVIREASVRLGEQRNHAVPHALEHVPAPPARRSRCRSPSPP